MVLLTTRLKVPALFALLPACFAGGGLPGRPLPEMIRVSKTGFGSNRRSLGILVVPGVGRERTATATGRLPALQQHPFSLPQQMTHNNN